MVDESFRISTLRAVKLFEPLSDAELELVRPAVGVREYSIGDVIIAEGTEGDELFVLLLGEAKIVKNHRTVEETVVATVRPIEVIGEMALLFGDLRSATIVATESCRFVTLSREAFEEILVANPTVCLHLLQDAYARIQHLLGRVGAES